MFHFTCPAPAAHGHPRRMPLGLRAAACGLVGMFAIAIAIAIASGGRPATAAPVESKIPLAADRADSVARSRRETKTAWLRDLAAGDGDVIVAGRIDAPAGRYRLHASTAVHPLGDAATAGLAITMRAGEVEKTFGTLVFALSDEFTDLTIDFTAAGRGTPVTIGWSFAGDAAAIARDKAIAVPAAPLLAGDDDPLRAGADDVPELEDRDAPLPLEQARAMKRCLLLRDIHVEPLSPVAIRGVRSDKITYRRGDAGQAAVELHNAGPAPATVSLAVEIEGGIDRTWPVATETLTIPAGSSTTWQGAFETADLSWGCTLRATATVKGFPAEDGGAIFSVPDNFWDVAVMAACPAQMTRDFVSMERAREAAARLKEQGYNGFEAYFWAPCDFLDYTPATEEFFSGQTSYVQSIAGTRNLITACHALGIRATFYANLWGGSGEPAFEMMRRHPDWFGGASFHTGALDDAALKTAGVIRGAGQKVWSFNQINPDAGRGLVDHHVDEILGSHRLFGWDGIRYDSYYSGPWTIEAMTHIRERMRREAPGFLFGYNAFADAEYRAGAMDSIADGLVMAEGVRVGPGSAVADYLHRLNTWREICWPYGSALGPLYGFTTQTKATPSPLDHVLMASVLMAVGGHPYYSLLGGGVGDHPAFAVRHAELIYDTRLRDVADPERVVAFGDGVEPLRWRELVRTREIAKGRQRLVLHVLNVAKDAVLGDPAMRCAAPSRNVPVRFTLPDGAKPVAAWLMQAYPTASRQPLPLAVDGSSATLTLPELRFYGLLVFDYAADAPLSTTVDAKARRMKEATRGP